MTNNFFSLHIFWSHYHLVTPTHPPLWWRNTWTVPYQNNQARYILFLTHFEICRLLKSFYLKKRGLFCSFSFEWQAGKIQTGKKKVWTWLDYFGMVERLNFKDIYTITLSTLGHLEILWNVKLYCFISKHFYFFI